MIKDTAHSFAISNILPYANEWDSKSHFPKEILPEIAELGFGGIYVSEEAGGCALGRLESSLIIEGLSYGCSSLSAYISIVNMVNSIIDKNGS